jgi:hypothetical protein
MAVTHAEQESGGARAREVIAFLGGALTGYVTVELNPAFVSHETATVEDVLLIRRSGDEVLVTDEMLDATALRGTPGDTGCRVDELPALGVDEVVPRFPESIDASLVRGQIAQLAPFTSPAPAGNAVTTHGFER